ncbi:1,2-phenylacetyl-CoA epoxidase subunit PaaD [Bacillus sp. UNC41MFS5]|uniref:1,2-phenylacetyl-CoA epoxidase subunit PaaD n=1 Tax=Bacillus sp. UNC41MFS5 TaxID=1449046 RepID=UPI00047AA0A7|nr:1,2-phenylacetyl-CoA epoxidase subunit PaaD [Bacillus sp. UNC41MFS5]
MIAPLQITQEDVLSILENVKDPEIDTVSIIDLGMVEEVSIQNCDISIKILPTFLGCPALEIIKNNIVRAVKGLPTAEEVSVEFIQSPPWTSDRISEKGQQGLKAFGIAPPPKQMEEDGSWHVDCPYCGSTYVTLENIFGPTACRSILYCKSCKNPFEAMKPISNLM